ncbi:MAG TPA: hypothetical protein VK005_02755 [Acholeplasma sp.]|nr:hypothetical protein [Acholeplasma sp.]
MKSLASFFKNYQNERLSFEKEFKLSHRLWIGLLTLIIMIPILLPIILILSTFFVFVDYLLLVSLILVFILSLASYLYFYLFYIVCGLQKNEVKAYPRKHIILFEGTLSAIFVLTFGIIIVFIILGMV